VRLRQCKYLNHIVEQDHRSVKERTWLSKGYVIAMNPDMRAMVEMV
jgi:transposase-like protein